MYCRFQRILFDLYIMMSLIFFFQAFQDPDTLMMGGVLMFLWWPKRKSSTPFHWDWCIILISVFLSAARAVRCRLKCHNERNPRRQLLTVKAEDSGGTAIVW